MIKINETTLLFLENDCIQQFGNEKGITIFQRAETIYQDLLHKADYRKSDAIQNHLQFKMFPTMAYYKALRAEGISQEKALEYVKKETHKAASVQKEKMSKLGNMPFAYTFYRMGVKKHMKKNFPDNGWKTEWIKCNGKEIHFNLNYSSNSCSRCLAPLSYSIFCTFKLSSSK
ncbi:MAG: L-2-amino-thiazoline-4-carboxylic acid hydrolase [Lachnospiraceae bacterium]|nr:L-2-amino-thiazoline-4-carboxylic acid hydrolase [Lachnospiraceae bacterium]